MPQCIIGVRRPVPPGASLAAVWLAFGCGSAPPPEPAAPHAGEPCVVTGGGETRSDLVGAALGADTLLLNPPRSQLMVGLTCDGRAEPRIAQAWSSDSSRTAWTLTVPDAGAVVARWRADAAPAAALRDAGVTSIVPLDDRRLVVTFAGPQEDPPGVFAAPALAAGRPAGPWIQLRASGADLRDALDGGTDLVVSADARVLEYADARQEWASHLLPWNRTYVLLTRGGAPAGVAGGDSAGFRAALARNAVRVAARAAEPPFWWEHTERCDRSAARSSAAPESRVVYPRADEVARALAERLVALSPGGLVARGLGEAELHLALARETAAGYVLAVPRRALVPCRETRWWPAGMAAVPLIDTRPTLLLRAGAGPLAVDHDGGLHPVERQ